MTRQQFLQLSEDDQNIFLSKLHHALRNNDECFRYSEWVVAAAKETGMFDNVKFGDEVLHDVEFDEAIVHPTKGLLFLNHKNNHQMIADPKDGQEELAPEPAVANNEAVNEGAGSEEDGAGEGEE